MTVPALYGAIVVHPYSTVCMLALNEWEVMNRLPPFRLIYAEASRFVRAEGYQTDRIT